MIDVRMKPNDYSAPFIPDNPSTRLTAKDFFMDEESADVVFEVKGGVKQMILPNFMLIV